jgi:hypothetical protein
MGCVCGSLLLLEPRSKIFELIYINIYRYQNNIVRYLKIQILHVFSIILVKNSIRKSTDTLRPLLGALHKWLLELFWPKLHQTAGDAK